MSHDQPQTPQSSPTVDLSSDLDSSLKDLAVTRSLFQDAWRRFKRNKLAIAGLALLGGLLLVAIFGPLLISSPTKLYPEYRQHPSSSHLMGTDPLGRDVLARVVYGIRLSIFIGFMVVALETIFGVFVGAVAGWFGGLIDSVTMRIVDIGLGIPYLLLAFALVTVIGGGVPAVILTLAATAWLSTARIVRAGILQVKQLEYIEAVRALGIPTRKILLKHILPNVMQPVVVLMAIGVGTAILSEAALSFLGVGVKPPAPSLGLMIAESTNYLSTAPHLLIFPGIAIILTVLGFLLVGDGLRDALDVKDAG